MKTIELEDNEIDLIIAGIELQRKVLINFECYIDKETLDNLIKKIYK